MVKGNHFPETFVVVAIGLVVVVASVVVAAAAAVVVVAVVVVAGALACTDGVVVVASTPSVDVAVQYNVGLGMEMTPVLLVLSVFVSMLNCSIWLFWLTSLENERKTR